jgi:hypothetical protein
VHPVALRVDADSEGRAFNDGGEKGGFDAEMLLSLSINLEQGRPEILKDTRHATLLCRQGRTAVRPDDNALIAVGNHGPTVTARRHTGSDRKHLADNAWGDGPRGYCHPDAAADFTQPPVGSPG